MRSIGALPGRCCAAPGSPGICAGRSPTTSTTRWSSTCRSARTAIARTAISCASRRCGSRCASSGSAWRRCRPGPVKVNDRKVAPPPRAEMKQSMEALIHHFKLYTEGYHVPAGETYTVGRGAEGRIRRLSDRRTAPTGRIAARSARPASPSCRRPSSCAKGHMLADVVAIIGSMDIVFGEIDR